MHLWKVCMCAAMSSLVVGDHHHDRHSCAGCDKACCPHVGVWQHQQPAEPQHTGASTHRPHQSCRYPTHNTCSVAQPSEQLVNETHVARMQLKHQPLHTHQHNHRQPGSLPSHKTTHASLLLLKCNSRHAKASHGHLLVRRHALLSTCTASMQSATEGGVCHTNKPAAGANTSSRSRF